MAYKRTQEMVLVWVQVPGHIDRFFEAMENAEGTAKMAFRNACFGLKLPYTVMYAYVDGQPELKARYDAFLKSKADLLAHEALEDVAAAMDKDTAAVAKVRADTKLRIAEKWDRERYGERVQIDRAPQVPGGDAALLGFASELLKLVREREPRVLEQEGAVVPALGDGSV